MAEKYTENHIIACYEADANLKEMERMKKRNIIK